MKIFIINDRDYVVQDESGKNLGTFTNLSYAKLFCASLFHASMAETVYGPDGQALMGSLDELLADVSLIYIE